jgi:Na+/serine symporter
VKRIFLSLSIVSCLALATAFGFGWSIGGADVAVEIMRRQVSLHLLTALGASLLCMMVHAISLTYFMGTGRWIEETCTAYRLGDEARKANIRLKYRAIPGMVACILAVIVTGAFGAMSSLGTSQGRNWTSTVHFLLACLTLGGNVVVSWLEYTAISRNAVLIDAVVQEVRRIRKEKGLSD